MAYALAVSAFLIFTSTAVCAKPEIQTTNGVMTLIVDGDASAVMMRKRVQDSLTEPVALVTKDLLDAANDKISQMDTRLMDMESMFSELMANVTLLQETAANKTIEATVENIKQRLATAEGSVTSNGASIALLQTGKADASSIVTDADIADAVEDMLKPSTPLNDLKVALNGKLDITQQYDNDDAKTLIASLVNGGDTSHALYTTLGDVKSRVETLEDAVSDDCGSHCKAGEYVSQACTADQSTVCSTCDAGFFSLGGLPTACTQCTVCPDDQYVVQGCTQTSDTVCASCTQCEAGVSYQSADCSTSTDRLCSMCDSCAATEFQTSACTPMNNTACQACTVCDGDFDALIECGDTNDATCRFRPVGFRATKLVDNANLGIGNGDVTNWIHDGPGAQTSLFTTVGDAFDGTSFTTPEAGFYFSAINLRYDDVTSRYIRAMVTLNNTYSANEGLHVMKGDIDSNWYTLSTAGVLRFDGPTALKASYYSDTDTDWIMDEECGFSVMKLPVTEGVMAEQSATLQVENQALQWVYPTSYRTDSQGGFQLGGTFSNGVYTARDAGVFVLSATQRIDAATGRYMRLAIQIGNNPSVENGLHGIIGQPYSAQFLSLHVSGLAFLNAGDTARVSVINEEDVDYRLQDESFFSAARIETTSAFAADKVADTRVQSIGWVDVTGYRTSVVPGLFNLGGDFNPTTGRYTAPVDGYYLVSANFRLDGTGGRYFRVMIRCSGDSNNPTFIHKNGIMSIRGSKIHAQFQHLNPSGVMYARKGQSIWVAVYSDTDNDYVIQHESGFSVALITQAKPE